MSYCHVTKLLVIYIYLGRSIVFVHGLRGHPKSTWTFESISNNRLSSVLKKKPKESDEAYWPRDILPQDFPNARIITYGYDSHFTGSFGTTANQCGISDHGQDLLSGLEHIRRADPKRPLIFVAHSLGGLVVKEVRYLPLEVIQS